MLIRNLKKKTLSSFLALMQLHTCRKIVLSNYRLEKVGKIKVFCLVVMPEHVQKELLKLHGIKFHGNKIIIEEVTSTRLKRPDEENTPAKYNRSCR